MFLHLIRALFPRWSFFDRAGDDRSLEIKNRGADDWHRVSFRCSRPLFGLFINPGVNLALAQQSLIEQFIQDLQARPGEIESLTSYKMISALTRRSASGGDFQFRVSIKQAGKIVFMYASPWRPAAPL